MALSIELLKKVQVVYAHAHCPDGRASAMILADAFRMLGTKPRIEFLAHNTPEHNRAGVFTLEEAERGDMVLFCDFAPVESKKGAAGIIVLDHHVGAKDIVESFGELGVYADAEKEPGVSGAVLAFREVWCRAFLSRDKATIDLEIEDLRWEAVRAFAECIGARDTWQTGWGEIFQRGQWASKYLMSKPFDRCAAPYLGAGEMYVGRALFEAHEEAVRQAVDQCAIFDVAPDDGRPALLAYVFQEQASGFRLTSDVAETLRERAPHFQSVVAGFSYVVDKPGVPPKLLYSLRGIGGFDVCALAKANGGGGHKAAAGFSVATRKGDAVVMTDPYEEIRRRLETFLIPGAGTSL